MLQQCLNHLETLFQDNKAFLKSIAHYKQAVMKRNALSVRISTFLNLVQIFYTTFHQAIFDNDSQNLLKKQYLFKGIFNTFKYELHDIRKISFYALNEKDNVNLVLINHYMMQIPYLLDLTKAKIYFPPKNSLLDLDTDDLPEKINNTVFFKKP